MTPVVDITRGSLVGKLLRHGSLYFIGNVITRFVSLLLIPLDTHLFTPSDYGTIVTITSVTRVMVIFVGLYLDSAYSRFYHEYKHDPVVLRKHISTLYWFVMLWGLAVVAVSLGVVAWVVRPKIPIWPVFVLAFISPLLSQLGMMCQAYLQQNHRSGLQVTVSLSNLFLNISVMLLAVGVFKVGLVGKFIGIFCGTGLFFLLGTIILIREGYLRFVFSRPLLVQSLRFSIPLIPNIAAGWIAGFSDRILLSMYGPLAETGVYNVGYSLGMGLSLFSQSIFMVYGPIIYALMTDNPHLARKRIERFVPYYFLLMLAVFFALSMFSREIVTVLTPIEYVEATAIVPIVLFAYFLGSQYQTAITILSFAKKTGTISSGAIGQAVVNLGLNLLLIPHFGKIAAAWTTVVAVALYSFWMIYWSQRTFRLHISLRRICIYVLSVGAPALAYWIFDSFVQLSWPMAVIVKVCAIIAVAIMNWLLGGIEDVDKNWLQLRVRSMITRFMGASG